jgi:putative sigma-54 modulation protein
VLYETQVFEETEALNKQFAQLNKEFPAQVLRTKKVVLDLMTVDEAIDAMEAVGHDFFVFREIESGAMQIIYRRQAEGYGILIPENRD